jgi:hypothetical protein
VQFLKFFLTLPTASQLQYDSFWVEFYRIRALDKIRRREIGIFSSSHENESFAGFLMENATVPNDQNEDYIDLTKPMSKSYWKKMKVKGFYRWVLVRDFKKINDILNTNEIVPILVSGAKAFTKSRFSAMRWSLNEFAFVDGFFFLLLFFFYKKKKIKNSKHTKKKKRTKKKEQGI